MTRSMARSKSMASMPSLPSRAARSAASLQTFAISAPAKPGVCPASEVDVEAGREREVGRVDLEDGRALAAVWPVDEDLAVEAARAQERRVEDVGPVRGRHQDDALLGVEAVHLDEQLVERVLALVVAAHDRAPPAAAADGVDLVDEDDAGRLLLGLLEEVAHARRADADEHLDEVRAREREERDAGLAGDGLGEQRLARPGRPDEQDALGQLAAQARELVRRAQKLDDLLDLLLGLVEPGDVGERDRARPRSGRRASPCSCRC